MLVASVLPLTCFFERVVSVVAKYFQQAEDDDLLLINLQARRRSSEETRRVQSLLTFSTPLNCSDLFSVRVPSFFMLFVRFWKGLPGLESVSKKNHEEMTQLAFTLLQERYYSNRRQASFDACEKKYIISVSLQRLARISILCEISWGVFSTSVSNCRGSVFRGAYQSWVIPLSWVVAVL